MIAYIENLIQNLLQVSISMAVVLAVALLLLPLWQRRYSTRWRKVIWLVIAVRLLIPFSLQLPSAPVQLDMDLQSAPAWTKQQAGLPEQAMNNPAVMPGAQNITINNYATNSPMGTKPVSAVLVEQKKQPISRGVNLFGLWMTGMLAVLLYHGVQYGRFRRKALACAKPLEDSAIVLQQAAADLNLRHYPAVLVTSQVRGPMLLGYLQPVILLPERMFNQQELLLILRHELMHHKQCDLWYKLILLLASAVHWFNPLVHWMNRQANRDVEQVCDELVVQGQDMAYRKAYSMTILNTMASQRGIAMSTYLSREAQNSKKRFAAILQPKAYKRGAVVLAAVIVLVVMVSGCLQLGSRDAGLGFYEKVAAFLPENAIADPKAYTVMGEDEESGYLIYTWGEEPYEVPEEEAYGNGSGYTGDDGRHYRYQRWLTISVDKEDGAMVYMQYHRNEDDMKPPVKPAEIGHDAQIRMNYVKKVARKLVDGGETLIFREENVKPFSSDQEKTSVLGYLSVNSVNGHYCAMALNETYGYLETLYTRYDMLPLRGQVLNWLATEKTRLYGGYYDILNFEILGYEQNISNNSLYTISLQQTMYYRNKGNKDENTYLNHLKAAGSPDYQWMYEEYDQLRESTMHLKIEAEILPDGTLDMEHAKLYTTIDGEAGSMYWEAIPGLYVFLRNGDAEVAGWSKDKTQILWVADCYLHAYVQQDLQGMRQFSTVEPILSDNSYLTGADYTPMEPKGQEYREQLVDQFQRYYSGQAVDENTTVQLQLALQVNDNYPGTDHLNLTLQKIGQQWKVTAAAVERVQLQGTEKGKDAENK